MLLIGGVLNCNAITNLNDDGRKLLKVLTKHMPGDTEENSGYRSPAQEFIWDLPNMMIEF
jgi:hypothetical protein